MNLPPPPATQAPVPSPCPPQRPQHPSPLPLPSPAGSAPARPRLPLPAPRPPRAATSPGGAGHRRGSAPSGPGLIRRRQRPLVDGGDPGDTDSSTPPRNTARDKGLGRPRLHRTPRSHPRDGEQYLAVGGGERVRVCVVPPPAAASSLQGLHVGQGALQGRQAVPLLPDQVPAPPRPPHCHGRATATTSPRPWHCHGQDAATATTWPRPPHHRGHSTIMAGTLPQPPHHHGHGSHSRDTAPLWPPHHHSTVMARTLP